MYILNYTAYSGIMQGHVLQCWAVRDSPPQQRVHVRMEGALNVVVNSKGLLSRAGSAPQMRCRQMCRIQHNF